MLSNRFKQRTHRPLLPCSTNTLQAQPTPPTTHNKNLAYSHTHDTCTALTLIQKHAHLQHFTHTYKKQINTTPPHNHTPHTIHTHYTTPGHHHSTRGTKTNTNNTHACTTLTLHQQPPLHIHTSWARHLQSCPLTLLNLPWNSSEINVLLYLLSIHLQLSY